MYKIKKTALNRSRLLTGTYKTVWSIVRAVLLIGLSFIILYPLIYMVSIAFRPLDELFDPSVVWIPKHLTLKNIKFAMEKMNMLKPVGTENSLFNSVVVNLLSALLQVASTAFVGYGFARFEFKLRGFLFGVVIFTMVVPVNSIIIPLFLNYRNLHLLDSYFAFYIPAILGQGIRSGLFIFIFRQFFKGMPKEFEDAASVDGCGGLRTFLQIFVPKAGPAFLTSFLFSIVWYWNDYYYSSMFFPTKQTVSLALAGLRNLLSTDATVGRDPYQLLISLQAGSFLVCIPLLLMYMFLQRYFVQSIERTGIVG